MAFSPPFGMLMPERSVGSANYRYLYNGMEVQNKRLFTQDNFIKILKNNGFEINQDGNGIILNDGFKSKTKVLGNPSNNTNDRHGVPRYK